MQQEERRRYEPMQRFLLFSHGEQITGFWVVLDSRIAALLIERYNFLKRFSKTPRDSAMLEQTGFLYARPNFFEGMARLLDFGNTLSVYNSSGNASEADQNAILSDYQAIADDIKAVTESRSQNQSGKLERDRDILREIVNDLQPEEIDNLLSVAMEAELERRRPESSHK